MSPIVISQVLKVPMVDILVLCSKQEEAHIIDYFMSAIEDKEWIVGFKTVPFIQMSLANGTIIRIVSNYLLTDRYSPNLLLYTNRIDENMYKRLVLLRDCSLTKTVLLRCKGISDDDRRTRQIKRPT